MSSPADDDDKYDDGIEEAIDDAEEEASVYVQRYYDSLTMEDIGRSLARFHEGPNLPTDRDFYTSPRTLDEIDNPGMTPRDHPLCAIAWILNEAPTTTIIRVYCFRLTDFVAIDLLIHAGATKTVQVILQDNVKTKEALKAFVKFYGDISRKSLLENVEIRMATTNTSCESTKVQMHDKCVITDNYTTFGSYDLSAFAHVGNWESITVVDTRQIHIDKFDAIWQSIPKRQMERYYKELDSPTMGVKRKSREDQASAESNRKRPAT
jgi:PLD-like domain